LAPSVNFGDIYSPDIQYSVYTVTICFNNFLPDRVCNMYLAHNNYYVPTEWIQAHSTHMGSIHIHTISWPQQPRVVPVMLHTCNTNNAKVA